VLKNPARPVLQIKNKGGAPKGNRNALKHGRYTAEIRDLKRRVRFTIRRAKAMCAVVDHCIREDRLDLLSPLWRRPNN
jgi:hypothetical protein